MLLDLQAALTRLRASSRGYLILALVRLVRHPASIPSPTEPSINASRLSARSAIAVIMHVASQTIQQHACSQSPFESQSRLENGKYANFLAA